MDKEDHYESPLLLYMDSLMYINNKIKKNLEKVINIVID